MKEINVDGIIVFDYEGEKAPLIFIHAFPLSSEMWSKQVSFFKDKYRVITYDIRGLGRSKQNNNQFTLEEYANDLLLIYENLHLNKVCVCGLSMGGYIILRALEKAPEIFSCVILADTRAERDTDEALISRSNAIINIKAGKVYDVLNEYLKKLLSEKNYNIKAIKDFVFNIMSNNSEEGIIGALLAIATRTTTLESLKSLNIPSLILVGEHDILTPIQYSENMKKSLSNSILDIIPNSGHLSNIENPEYFNNSIYEFLQKYL